MMWAYALEEEGHWDVLESVELAMQYGEEDARAVNQSHYYLSRVSTPFKKLLNAEDLLHGLLNDNAERLRDDYDYFEHIKQTDIDGLVVKLNKVLARWLKEHIPADRAFVCDDIKCIEFD